MTPREFTAQRIAWRLDYANFVGETYEGPPGDMGLEPGDMILRSDKCRGLTLREVESTPHRLDGPYHEDSWSYVREYWHETWNGLPLRALKARQAAVEQYKVAEAQREKKYAERFGPPPGYRSKTLENFVPKTDSQREAVHELGKFPYTTHAVEGDEKPDMTKHLNVLLLGPVGTGKSHLASAVYNYYMDSEWCQFISARELERKFKEARSHAELMRRYGDGQILDEDDDLDCGCEALFIDDLGVATDPWTAQLYGEILDRRVAAELTTVITSNLKLRQLREWLGERTYSRLCFRSEMLFIDGPDHRLMGSESC